ncbi:hypothetical protein OIU78_029680 [Salix suchowensis]|nr:hypothetical protein OIU78_029680 [Salix suchowensis]
MDKRHHVLDKYSGFEIWWIENFRPIPSPKSSHGIFFMGDSYLILKTTALKSGSLCHDIHYCLGKDTCQDEGGVAAIKTVELDAALGGRAVQYREVQGHETEKFSSYLNHVLYHKKVELRLASNILRLRCTRHACLSAQENMLSM